MTENWFMFIFLTIILIIEFLRFCGKGQKINKQEIKIVLILLSMFIGGIYLLHSYGHIIVFGYAIYEWVCILLSTLVLLPFLYVVME